MELKIYQPPEDEEEARPVLRIFPGSLPEGAEGGESEAALQQHFIAKQRAEYQRPFYVSPWDPADTL